MDAKDSKQAARGRRSASSSKEEKLETSVADLEVASLRERLQVVFGSPKGAVATQLTKLADHEDRISKWLGGSPDRQQAFRDDPIGVLARQFPELGLTHTRDFERLPPHIGLDVEFGRAPDPLVQELFAKVWAHLSASETHATSFRQAPFAVIATVGAGYAADKVDAVMRAFEAVYGIVRLEHVGPSIAAGVASGRVVAALAALAQGGSNADA